MVKGQPKNDQEAFQVLDELVRQTFLFLGDNPSHVAKSQPSSSYYVTEEHDKELTERLKEAGILSEGYVAVLSGKPTKTGKTIDGGNYQLVIYNINDSGFERNEMMVNAQLHIQLTRGSNPGIQNASGTYTVSRFPIVYEEARNIRETLVNKTRDISITQKVVSVATPEPQTDSPDDVLAYQTNKTKKPLDTDGRPIPDFLFPGAKARFSEHPKGTTYRADEIGNICCYFPKK